MLKASDWTFRGLWLDNRRSIWFCISECIISKCTIESKKGENMHIPFQTSFATNVVVITCFFDKGLQTLRRGVDERYDLRHGFYWIPHGLYAGRFRNKAKYSACHNFLLPFANTKLDVVNQSPCFSLIGWSHSVRLALRSKSEWIKVSDLGKVRRMYARLTECGRHSY